MYTLDKSKIDAVIKKRNWCISDIAKLAGINYCSAYGYMHKGYDGISLNNAVKLAIALEIPIQDLIVEV